MKKIDKISCFEYLSYTKLYLDDLERIVETMEEQSLDVFFNDNEYEFDSLKEVIEKRGKRKSHIEIVGKKVDKDKIWPHDVTLIIDGRKLLLKAHVDLEFTWHQIKEFIISRTPWYARFTDVYVWTWGWITFVIGQYTYFIASESKTWLNSLVLIVALIFTFSLFKTFTNRGVVLVHRHVNQNFFVKN